MLARGATRANPRVDLGQLTLPETTDLMGGQVFMLDPTIDRVLSDSEVFGNLVDGDPGFSHQSFFQSRSIGLPLATMDSVARKILPTTGVVVNSGLRPAIAEQS